MGPFDPTYRPEDGPKPTSYEEYFTKSKDDYVRVLSDASSEPEVQSFLEQHPIFVPGHSTPGALSGHFPLHCALITQPDLPGVPSFRPDFMWISTNSAVWYPTLIEIESPKKRIFTKQGNVSSDFCHARDQLDQWRIWFDDPANVQQFIKKYRIPDYLLKRTMRLHRILIYGRRDEFENSHVLTKRVANLLPEGAEIMSFDRLKKPPFEPAMSVAITVKSRSSGSYKAVWIPEVFEVGPDSAERLLSIDGIPEAIDCNPSIGRERKVFLRRRILYWREWASSGASASRGERE